MDKESLSIELDGKINLVHLDADGKLISREELDGEVCLKALLHVITEAVMNYKDE